MSQISVLNITNIIEYQAVVERNILFYSQKLFINSVMIIQQKCPITVGL